jgi:hypothetical protein
MEAQVCVETKKKDKKGLYLTEPTMERDYGLCFHLYEISILEYDVHDSFQEAQYATLSTQTPKRPITT